LLAAAVPLFGLVYLGGLRALGYRWPRQVQAPGVVVLLRRRRVTRRAS
jgi:hypothetical protein